MKLWPTSGPITSSVSQNAREANSSPRSLRSRTLSERKEGLFDVAELRRRAGRDHAAVIEQQQAIADSRRVPQLMDREDERPFHASQQFHRGAHLPQIEPVERLVEEEHRMRSDERERDVEPLGLAFGKGGDSL